MILASYNNACCITGLDLSELLVASHIIPWATDENNRMNPRNGLALNPLHDNAFEQGFIAITADYRVAVSPTLKKKDPLDNLLWRYQGMAIRMPTRFLPDPDFLALHYEERFRK
ncbi:MAG: HNH endonuclease [Parapedobacter sp.]|nr:MAG: HNH endonuclease [Parapedobacter sp.]